MLKLKVSLVAPNLSGKGGTETVIDQVIKSRKLKEVMDFSVFLPDKVSNQEWINSVKLNVHKGTFASKNKLANFIHKFTFYITTDADILLILGMKSIFIAFVMRILFHKKYKIVSWIHFTLQGTDFSTPKFLKYADAHLAISSGIKRQLESIGIESRRIFLIYNPATETKQNIVLNRSKTVHYVFIGRVELNKQKNIKLLLNGLSDLNYSWKLDVFGSGDDLKKCQLYAELIGIDQNISWYGWVNDPWSRVKDVDALLLTSNFEGLPMVIIESLQRGLPVISSDCPTGPEDEIVESVNGYLFQSNSQKDFVKKLNKFYQHRQSFNNQERIKSTVKKFDLVKYESSFYNALKEISR